MNMPYRLLRSKDDRMEQLLEKMVEIGIMLSAEKDVNSLIVMILEASMAIVGCDAGSIYIVEKTDEGKCLRFMKSMNHSRTFEFNEMTLHIDKESIAGYCAYTRKPYLFHNMEEMTEQMHIRRNEYFDREIDYHTTNMMVIPMLDINNEVLGVLQLINKKSDPNRRLDSLKDYEELITPFNNEEEKMILSLASQAGMLIERTKLMDDVEKLFQNFVRTMVLTIDKRDPTTAGHSERVAKLAIRFARTIHESDEPPFDQTFYNEDQMREIYYAALLHDIGKIGVKEDLLRKRDKLNHNQIEKIKFKFLYIKKVLEEKSSTTQLNKKEKELYMALDEIYKLILEVNHAGYLQDDAEMMLKMYAEQWITDSDGGEFQVLDPHERDSLLIKRGNLSDEERRMMKHHAYHTYEILKEVPWPVGFERIPRISAAHHENLDGSGYPDHLTSNQILFESKMLAIADVFEALTAKDRPYRRGMSIERALEILKAEADANHFDKRLVDLFINKQVYMEEGKLVQ